MVPSNCTGKGGNGWIALRGNGRSGALDNACPRTRRVAVETAIGQHAERVDVGGEGNLATLQLLRCAVAGRADTAEGNVRCRMPGVGRSDVFDESKVGKDWNCNYQREGRACRGRNGRDARFYERLCQ